MKKIEKPTVILDLNGKPNGKGNITYTLLEDFKKNLENDLSKLNAEPLKVIEFYRKTYIERSLLIDKIRENYMIKRHNKPNFNFSSIGEEFDLDNTRKSVDILIQFEDYLDGIETVFIKLKKEGKADETINKFKFENTFDKVESDKVYKHFYELVEKDYLSKEDLEKYLKLAFQEKKLPIEKFSFRNLEIEKVRTIFYTYYKDVATNTHAKKKLYASLLGDYFNSFTTIKVMNNFADGYKIVRKRY